MKYPIAIEPGDKIHAFGVVVPDLPGCFSAGDTLDEAIDNAKEAIELWLEIVIDDGGAVAIDLATLSDKSERVNITLPARVLRRIDAAAKDAGESRSGYIARRAMAA